MFHKVCRILILVVLMTGAGLAQVTNKKLTGQDFTGEITISAGPQAVWAVLTDWQKVSNILGLEYKGAAKKMMKVGDNAAAKYGGDTGSWILVYAKPSSELRYAWEPDNGSYLCQARWLLTPAGNGTKVSYEDRYTESGPQTAEAIAEQIKSYNQALARLKSVCEGK
jgi:uncharacterized protein YndB with AHSA1/START domain